MNMFTKLIYLQKLYVGNEHISELINNMSQNDNSKQNNICFISSQGNNDNI